MVKFNCSSTAVVLACFNLEKRGSHIPIFMNHADLNIFYLDIGLKTQIDNIYIYNMAQVRCNWLRLGATN